MGFCSTTSEGSARRNTRVPGPYLKLSPYVALQAHVLGDTRLPDQRTRAWKAPCIGRKVSRTRDIEEKVEGEFTAIPINGQHFLISHALPLWTQMPLPI